MTRWTDVCALTAIIPDSGVCALVNGEQVAVFRLQGDTVYAIANIDPFSGAAVLSRGIVGDRDGIPKVASPIHKQSFSLQSGICLDDEAVAVRVYDTRVVDGAIQVAPRQEAVGVTPAA